MQVLLKLITLQCTESLIRLRFDRDRKKRTKKKKMLFAWTIPKFDVKDYKKRSRKRVYCHIETFINSSSNQKRTMDGIFTHIWLIIINIVHIFFASNILNVTLKSSQRILLYLSMLQNTKYIYIQIYKHCVSACCSFRVYYVLLRISLWSINKVVSLRLFKLSLIFYGI